MAEFTRIVSANIRRQFSFVIATAAITRCLVENFRLICFLQRVNDTTIVAVQLGGLATVMQFKPIKRRLFC